jgi:hypothetical protein
LRLAAGLAVGLVTLLLAEGAVLLAVRSGVLETPPPNYGGQGFWRSHHPKFGVWHEPNASTVHATRCFTSEYRTNSVGARDAERPVSSSEPRVIVLGDSFLEGWGVIESKRMSNLLERKTGVSHLNFAMSHFSPYQQWIVYRDLASGFDHAAVIASLTPANDFLDLDLERANAMARYEYRYRPYLVGNAPDFEHLDHREPGWRRALRGYSALFNALLQAVRTQRDDASGSAPATAARRSPKSQFYDFDDAGIDRVEAVLQRLVESAAGRPTALLLIPTEADLRRRAVAGPDLLSQRLAPTAERLGIRLVNLLPAMAEYSVDWPGFFFPCDYHWSRSGNRVAAAIVRRELEDFYRR